MTKKDYVLIAEFALAVRPEVDGQLWKTEWYHEVGQLADKLETDNPRFDKNKFFRACGLAE